MGPKPTNHPIKRFTIQFYWYSILYWCKILLKPLQNQKGSRSSALQYSYVKFVSIIVNHQLHSTQTRYHATTTRIISHSCSTQSGGVHKTARRYDLALCLIWLSLSLWCACKLAPKSDRSSVTLGGPCVVHSHFPNGINCVAGYISDFSVSKNIRGYWYSLSA